MAPAVVRGAVNSLKPGALENVPSVTVIRTGVMGRLDDLDLSVKLSKEEADERLEAAQTRLLALRLVLGGLVGERGIGPPVCVLFEGWDASGKGGAIKRLVAELDPRHVRVVAVRRADLRREAPPLAVALLAGAAGLGRDGRARPLLVRARAGRARREVRHAASSGAAPTTRSTTSSGR